MSENTTASLKQEILEWANKPGTMEKFTTHDVYEHIHSAETPSHTSDALRSMWKYDKTLDREEFMDGNKKRFVYSLRKEVDLKPCVWSEPAPKPKKLNKGGEIPVIDVLSGAKEKIERGEFFKENPNLYSGNGCELIPESVKSYSIPGSVINCDDNNQQIEIPNNFCIELKTPNGFTITIKAGDLMK